MKYRRRGLDEAKEGRSWAEENLSVFFLCGIHTVVIVCANICLLIISPDCNVSSMRAGTRDKVCPVHRCMPGAHGCICVRRGSVNVYHGKG